MSDSKALVPASVEPELYFSPAQIDLIKAQIANKCTNDELKLFLYQCARTGLDPFSRQIYAISRNVWDPDRKCKVPKMTIQTGIDGYRLIADRTGRYAPGPDVDFEYKGDRPYKATAHVMKLVGGTWHKVSASAHYDEYVQQYEGKPSGLWSKPHIMLGKCAEALALRKAFPAELSGIYTAEEMSQADKDPPAPEYIPPKAETDGGSTPSPAATPGTTAGATNGPAAASASTTDPKEQPMSKRMSPRSASGAAPSGGRSAPSTKTGLKVVEDDRFEIKKLWVKNRPEGLGWNLTQLEEFLKENFRANSTESLDPIKAADCRRVVEAMVKNGPAGMQTELAALWALGRMYGPSADDLPEEMGGQPPPKAVS